MNKAYNSLTKVQFFKSLDTLIYGSLFNGGSLKEIQHLQQLWRSGDFTSFDFDPDGNRQYYNTNEPIVYPLKRISIPMVLYFGDTDAFATPEGVHRVYSRLLKSVVGVYRVQAPKFNHIDFYCGTDVKKSLNEKLIDTMEKYLQGKLQYTID